MVLNLLKFPILLFISLRGIFLGFFVLVATSLLAILLIRQSQILFDFMCVNTILRSRNMVLLRADYSYYF